MNSFCSASKYLLIIFFGLNVFSSCVDTRKVAYFNDVQDSARVASKAGLEPVIQKKDILSISVSSLSNEATVIFNMPNLPITPNAATTNTPKQLVTW